MYPQCIPWVSAPLPPVLGAIAPHKEHNRHFTDPDVSFLGTPADWAQRFGVELTLLLHNAFVQSGLTSDEDPDDFIKKLSYTDKNDHQKHLAGFSQFHPTRDVQNINRWLSYWKWHVYNTSRYLIIITKEQLRAHRSLPTCTDISPALFGHRQTPMVGESEDQPDETSPVVETVLGLLKTSTDVACLFFTPCSVLKTFVGNVGSQVQGWGGKEYCREGSNVSNIPAASHPLTWLTKISVYDKHNNIKFQEFLESQQDKIVKEVQRIHLPK